MASISSNVMILSSEDSALDKLVVSIASATTCARGDLIEVTSGAAVVVDNVSDNATFAGLAMNTSEDGDTIDVGILLRGICKIGVVSSTYAVGAALKYSTGANGTDWALTGATTGADGIMWSAQYKASAVTSLICRWDAFLVDITTAAGGLFESFAA